MTPNRSSPILKIACALLWVILLISIFDHALSFYLRWWWFDIPMHMVGGFVIALLFVGLFRDRYASRGWAFPLWALFSFGLGVVALTGVLWEFFEYAVSFLSGSWALEINDTIHDLLNDLLGGAAGLLAFIRRRQK